ncbi:MAG TPA: polysulfide reductase NrfD [Peptococcaceae bacterium]|nr:polysulfide reductase NrfD [Peptococcaceae bacterium]
MKHHEEGWGWMLAVDFFFAGMGGAMLLIAGVLDLLPGEAGTSLLGNICGPLFISLGACFLILELGRPFQAWRVFMNPKAILTIGAWTMTLAIGFGFIYASFGLDVFPWSKMVGLRKLCAVICIITGLIVATYPGILLGRHKSRPFWNGPGMMVLFLLSSLVTGGAAHLLSAYLFTSSLAGNIAGLNLTVALLLAFQFLVWLVYLWVKISGTTTREAVAARRWLNGEFAAPFKYGFLLAGTLVPFILLFFEQRGLTMVAACLVLIGGFIMRNLVVSSGNIDRTWLPGELDYRSRLPLGDEEFLRAWNNK